MIPLASYFNNPANLQAALVHRSYCNEHPEIKESNERLEFLGDSVLSLLTSQRLYGLLPNSAEGELTNRRSWIVQTTSLADKARMLDLHTKLLLSRGEEDSGGRENTGLLANTFEAVLGAMYLDAGLSKCEEFLKEIFPDDELLTRNQIKDSKSLLQEIIQASERGTPIYKVLSSDGPDHARTFTVGVYVQDRQIAVGEGTSKQRAEAAAATKALDVVK